MIFLYFAQKKGISQKRNRSPDPSHIIQGHALDVGNVHHISEEVSHQFLQACASVSSNVCFLNSIARIFILRVIT